MIAPSLLLAALAGALAVAAWIRTPDSGSPAHLPAESELWAGITGEPAPLRYALGTVLFWAVAACGLGLGGAVALLFAPGEIGLAVGVGTVVGAVLAVETARRMLQAGPGAIKVLPRRPKTPVGRVPRVLFVGGSPNQTGQMLQIARALPEVEAWFTPYYSDWLHHLMLMRGGAVEPAINGYKRRGLCADTLNALGLRVDLGAERNDYDLWVCPNDAVVPQEPWQDADGPRPGGHHGAAQLAHLGLAAHAG